jgi:CBS domain-containing protein
MTRHVLTIEEQASVDRASFMMRGRSIGCLLVLSAGQVIGIITTSDLLRQIGRGADRRRRATTDTAMHHRVVHRRTGARRWCLVGIVADQRDVIAFLCGPGAWTAG